MKANNVLLFDKTNSSGGQMSMKRLKKKLVKSVGDSSFMFKKNQSQSEQHQEPNTHSFKEQTYDTVCLKEQISNELHKALKQVELAMKQVEDQEYKAIFQQWISVNGVLSMMNLCLEGDKQAWQKVLTTKSNINYSTKNKRRQRSKQKIAIKLDFNGGNNKQNTPPASSHSQSVQNTLTLTNPNSLLLKKQFDHENTVKIQSDGQQKLIKNQEQNYIDAQLQSKSNNLNIQCKQSQQQSQIKQKQKKYLRGPYKNYPLQIKQQVVKLYNTNGVSLNKLSQRYGIPLKNIKRWADNGVERKEGAGRKKLDPEMQQKVFQRIINNYPIGGTLQENTIRQWALEQCKVKDFKASKGWINKFVHNHGLAYRYVIL